MDFLYLGLGALLVLIGIIVGYSLAKTQDTKKETK